MRRLRLLLLLLLLPFLPTPPTAGATSRDLDLVFLLDTTGSMSGELREAKERVRQLAELLAEARPGARVRLGVVAYRDKGDDYVTRYSPLSEDVEQAFGFLSGLTAGGGGDGPEHVLAGLRTTLTEINWDDGPAVDRQVFLIGDAPPHLDYPEAPMPDALIEMARSRRIVVNSVGCRSLPSNGVDFFRKVAYGTEGSYQHIGRVQLNASRPGTSGKGLAEVMLETLTPEVPAEAGRFVDARLVDCRPPRNAPGIQVEPVIDGERGTCGLDVAIPNGARLAREIWIDRDALGLRVHLTLASGQGELLRYGLGHCLAADTTISVVLED